MRDRLNVKVWACVCLCVDACVSYLINLHWCLDVCWTQRWILVYMNPGFKGQSWIWEVTWDQQWGDVKSLEAQRAKDKHRKTERIMFCFSQGWCTVVLPISNDFHEKLVNILEAAWINCFPLLFDWADVTGTPQKEKKKTKIQNNIFQLCSVTSSIWGLEHDLFKLRECEQQQNTCFPLHSFQKNMYTLQDRRHAYISHMVYYKNIHRYSGVRWEA